MKQTKFFIFSIFILIISQSTLWASRARMQSLGGENIAWSYFNDPRNIFINPAYINLNRDYLTFELGSDYDGVESIPDKPKAQGGYFKGIGYFVAGVYLGRDTGTFERLEIDAGNPPNFLYPDNPIEIFLGGDAGIEWGGSVEITDGQNQLSGIDRTQSSLKINIGVLTGPYEPYVRLSIYDKSNGGENVSESFKSHLGTTFGMNYFYERLIIHGEYSNRGHEYYRALDGIRDNLLEKKNITLGFGTSQQLNDLAKMYTDLSFHQTNTYLAKELSTPASTVYSKTKSWHLPITIGIEIQAKDYLIIRASIQQDVISRKMNILGKKSSSKNSTLISAGAGFILDKLKIDGMIGTTGTKGEKNDNVGVLSLNNILAQTSLTYFF